MTPTPIQAEAIPYAREGRDVIGIAQTGTGKTLAFGLPMIEHVLAGEGVGLILAPTRELALQIDDTLIKVGQSLGLRTATLIGGAPVNKQIKLLRNRPHIIVATPGRLEDHLAQRTITLGQVSVVVLDEADRMLDMGFSPAIKRILALVPKERQTMLFTATLPREIEDLAHHFLNNPIKVEVATQGQTAELVTQELFMVSHEEKQNLLETLLGEGDGSVLVFTRTRHGARKVAKWIRTMGHSAAELHSDRTLAQRRGALEGFKRGEHRVLVATDIASRGIDVKSISLVINYDLPDQPEDYVHRIGRTGRAGEEGRSLTIATPDQMKELQAIERLIRQEIPLSPASPLKVERGHRGQARPQFKARKPLAFRGPGTSRTGGSSYGRPRASAR